MDKETVIRFIEDYVKDRQEKVGNKVKWRRPLVGFADANHPLLRQTKELISPGHHLPEEVLPGATIVITYFIPFTKELVQGNRKGRLATRDWAVAYEETNALFVDLNQALIDMLTEAGYHGAVSSGANKIHYDTLMSDWSQRHVARVAGLGTFGMNNMLITKVGCAGRYSTVVTDLDVEADAPLEEERCLYKAKGICGACMKACPAQALHAPTQSETQTDLKDRDGYNNQKDAIWPVFDREKCFDICRENAAVHTGLGSSYEPDPENKYQGSQVCGKCVVAGPCAIWEKDGKFERNNMEYIDRRRK